MNLFENLGQLIILLSLLFLAVWPLSSLDPTVLSEHSSPQFVSIILGKEELMITNDLLKLARAIAEFEGWRYQDQSGVGLNHASVSWRNHNPGNLRKSPWAVGESDGFAVFVNDEVGFYALVWDLHQKALGNTTTGLNGQSTIYQLIKTYSGESEDIVLNYATFIEKRTGLSMNTKLENLIK